MEFSDGITNRCSSQRLVVFVTAVASLVIVVKKTPALSAPAENAPTLFELHEGFEVVILELKDDWIQVNYPGGLTGWVPKTAVLPSATQ